MSITDQYSSSFKEGQQAERKFAEYAKSFGWSVAPSTREQDKLEHWDLEISRGDERYKIDVKAMKRTNRGARALRDDLVWIELCNVFGRAGWLYVGKSDFIAFETKNGFVIPKRKAIVQYIYRSVDVNKLVSSPEIALYCVYSRKDRKDKLTLVRMDDLRALEQLNLK